MMINRTFQIEYTNKMKKVKKEGVLASSMEAFILVNAVSGKLWEVAEKIKKIEGVKLAQTVTGQFDVVIYIERKAIDELSSVIKKLQAIKGVIKTQTLIALPPSSLWTQPTSLEEKNR
jgi:DNA-binding Lrp family transcriptional regulator